jgi:hypothetical protein
MWFGQHYKIDGKSSLMHILIKINHDSLVLIVGKGQNWNKIVKELVEHGKYFQ